MARRKAIVDFEIKGNDGLTKIKHLEDRVRLLRKEWRHAEDAATRYKKEVEFKAANEELRRHRGRIYDTDTAWQKFKKTVGPIATGVLGANILSWIGSMATQLIPALTRNSAKLSDELADIQKNTGLLKSEVKELNSDLKTINTRSSRSELRALASEAGKLGKTSKEDILDFVRQADMINVALGDALGDDATAKIGKLANVFDTSMLQIGSSINTIGANSAANEGYLVDFLARLGGTAATADLAAPSVIGYGAVLDAMGLQVEMSGTALSNFFIDFVKDTEKFEKAAGMQHGALKKLIGEKGTNEGFLSFIENLKEASSSESEFLQKLEDIGIDGSRGASVFLTLANNTQLVREQQALANQAFNEGTSIIEEFNVKNNNTAAILEKINKWWSSFIESGGVKQLVDDMVIGFGKLIGVITEADIASQKYFEKQSEVDKYEKSLVPLIDRYRQLEEKTNKSVFEQEEMKKLVSQIAGIVPSAITEVDKYGNALAISAGKAKEFVDQQRAMLRYLNRESLQDVAGELRELGQEFVKIDRQIKSGQKYQVSSNTIGGRLEKKDLTSEEIAALRLRQQELGARRKELEQVQRGLSGNFDSPTVNTTSTTTDGGSGSGNGGGSGGGSAGGSSSKKKDPELEALKKKLDQQREALRKYHDEQYLENLSAADKEIVLIMQKWDQIMEETGASGDTLKEMQSRQAEEIQQAILQQKINGIESTIVESEKLLQQQHEAAMFALELRGASEVENQEQLNLSKLEQEQNYLTQLLLLRESFAIQDEELRNKIEENEQKQQILRVQRQAEVTRAHKESLEEQKRAEEELVIAKSFLYESGIAMVRNMFAQTSGIYKALFLIEKAYAIAQTIISGRRQISNLREAQSAQIRMINSTYPFPANVAIVAATSAKTLADIAKVKVETGIGVAQIAAQAIGAVAKKEKGGFTDRRSLGYTSGPALYGGAGNPFIAGEKGIEFVTSFQSLQHPLVADFTRALDAAQKTGDYSNLNSAGSQSNDKLLAALVLKQDKIEAAINRLANRPINFNIDHFEKAQDFIHEIRSSVTA